MGAHPSQKKTQSALYAIIINARNVTEIDAGYIALAASTLTVRLLSPASDSAAEILTEIKRDWEKRGICCCFVKLRENVMEVLTRSGLLKGATDPFLFKSMDDAVGRFSPI